MVSLDMALINQAADLIEHLSRYPGMTPERKARKREYMRDYMRMKRANKGHG